MAGARREEPAVAAGARTEGRPATGVGAAKGWATMVGARWGRPRRALEAARGWGDFARV